MANIDDLCIQTLMMLSVDAVEKAKSGHPGMPMGDSTMAYTLWDRFLRHSPSNPRWANRDRFVLSAGHGSMLLYSLLHMTGHKMSIDDIKSFRQWDSKTPGHPEHCLPCGIETTTGPLGQGFATGVGMAMAAKYLAGVFNRPGFPLIDYRVFGICSDGDIMEGVTAEAASLAGHLGLGNIVYLYSDNKITIEGSTDLAFTEDVERRFIALGWNVERADGCGVKSIDSAIRNSLKQKAKPTLVIVRTHIGYCSPNMQDTSEVHGTPLGQQEIRLTKESIKYPIKEFYVPKEVQTHMRGAVKKGKALESEWNDMFKSYRKKYPDLAKLWGQFASGDMPAGWEKSLPVYKPEDGGVATRQASGKVLNAIAPVVQNLIGGSADLAPSNNTFLKGLSEFSPKAAGRNIHFGVREHAMGAVMNGMALSDMLIPYGGTFLVFSDYLRPASRLSAMMGLKAVYVLTHDSIGLGEDGPTHQPIEHLMSYRAMPGMTVIRPADANETVEAWKIALNGKGPVALILSRQSLMVLDRNKYAPASHVAKGGYILYQSGGTPDMIFIASGAEVHVTLKAAHELEKKGKKVRVINMVSTEIFDAQPDEYRNTVLPRAVRSRLAVEAGATLGWHKYVGLDGGVIGIDRFGASAPASVLFEKFGFTVDNIVSTAEDILKKPK